MKKVSMGHSPESSLLVLNMHVPAQEAILQVCVCVGGAVVQGGGRVALILLPFCRWGN